MSDLLPHEIIALQAGCSMSEEGGIIPPPTRYLNDMLSTYRRLVILEALTRTEIALRDMAVPREE